MSLVNDLRHDRRAVHCAEHGGSAFDLAVVNRALMAMGRVRK